MGLPRGPGGRVSRRGTGASAFLLVLVIATGAPSSAYAVEAGAARDPANITYWGADDPRSTRKVVHTLALRAGHQEERFIVTSSSGAPITLSGPGELTPFGAASSARAEAPPRPGRDACPPRTTVLGASTLYRLTLPAGAAATLAYTDEIDLTRAPVNPSLFAARWTLAPAEGLAAGVGAGVVPGPGGGPPLVISEAPPQLLGLRATALTLRVGRTGSGEAIDAREGIRVGPRTDMTLSGTLSYARRGERIVVWRYAPGARRPAPIGSVRVDRHGRFLLPHWRPRRAGVWELYATYAGRPGSVEGTRSPCSGPQVTVA